ncbi:Kelch repeat-containing protein [Streptomyces sp. NPDC001156]
MPAGIAVSGDSLRVTQPLGRSATRTVTLRNTGTAPVHILLNPQDGSYTPDSHPGSSAKPGTGAAVRHIGGAFTSGPLLAGTVHGAAAPTGRASTTAVAGGTAWTTADALPSAVEDGGTVALDGKVYAFGGTQGRVPLSKATVYDPATGGWQRLANMPQQLRKPGVEAVGGDIYVVGGWDSTENASAAAYRYDPKHDSWSSVASLPAGVVAGGTAVLGGRLYVIAGCGGNCFPASQATTSTIPRPTPGARWRTTRSPTRGSPALASTARSCALAGPIRSPARRRRRRTPSIRSPARALRGPICRTRTGQWPPPPPAGGFSWSVASAAES